MKTGKWMKCIVTMMLLCISVLPVMAQKNIDKVVKELEGRSDVVINSVTKRDPKTRKVVSMTKTFSVKDARMAGALRRAFEKDEEFAITAHMNMPKGRANAEDMNLYFVFYPTENEKHSYSLTCNKNGEMTLTIIVKQEKMPRHYSSLDENVIVKRTSASKQRKKAKDDLGCIVSKNGAVVQANRIMVKDNGDWVLVGNVSIDNKKMKKGTYRLGSRKVVVR